MCFNNFCKKLLRNEAINALVALQRRKKAILNFSDINFDEEVMACGDDFTFDPDAENLVQGVTRFSIEKFDSLQKSKFQYERSPNKLA